MGRRIVFADFVAGLFSSLLWGQSAQKEKKNFSRKIPGKIPQCFCNKNPRHISARGAGPTKVQRRRLRKATAQGSKRKRTSAAAPSSTETARRATTLVAQCDAIGVCSCDTPGIVRSVFGSNFPATHLALPLRTPLPSYVYSPLSLSLSLSFSFPLSLSLSLSLSLFLTLSLSLESREKLYTAPPPLPPIFA